MKSKMKSAFALIAVALMVMVAVVPMIGVFTEDSDAAVILDPKTTDTITIKVKVYDATITSSTTKYVKITWGSSSQFSQIESITGTTSPLSKDVLINDTEMTNVKLTVVTTAAGTKADPSFKEVSMTGKLVGGNTYTADLVNGDDAKKSLTVNMANATAMGVATMFPAAKKITANYKLYDGNGESKKEIVGSRSSGDLTASVLDVYFPASATTVYVQITDIVVDGTTYNMKSDLGLVKGTGTLITKLSLDYFGAIIRAHDGTNYADVPNGTISGVAGKKDDTTPITDVVVIDNTFGKKDSNNAYVIYKTAEATKMWFTITFGNYSESFTDTTAKDVAASGLVNFVPAAGYWGVFGMTASVSATDGQSLVIKSSDGTTDTDLSIYVADGRYYAKFPTVTTVTKLKFTADFDVKTFGGENVTSNEFVVTSLVAAAKNIMLDETKGALVSGTIVDAPNAFTFSVTGFTKIFGAKVSGTSASVTCADNSTSYSFYVASGDKITFVAPTGVTFKTQFVGPFVVPAAGLTNNVELVDKALTFTFKDQDGKTVSVGTVDEKKVTVKYIMPGKTTETTPANADLTYTTGKIKVSLNDGTVDVSKIKVFFVSTDNDSFTAKDKDSAVLYTATNDVMPVVTLDKKYTIVLQDMNGIIITESQINVTPANGMQVLLYKARNAEGKVGDKQLVVYDNTDVTTAFKVAFAFDNDSKTYTFTANKDYVGVTLSSTNQYVLAVTFGTSVKYIFDQITQVKVDSGNEMVIKAYADEFKGKLVRHDLTTPIEGATVKLLNAKVAVADETAGNTLGVAVTGEDGSFVIKTKEKISSYAYANLHFSGTDNAWPVYSTTESTSIYSSYTSATVYKYASTFMPVADSYTVNFVDADDTAFIPAAGNYLTGLSEGTAATAYGVIAFTAVLTEDQIVTPVLSVSNTEDTKVRTFGKYTITADDIASGEITLTTKESKYIVNAVDADGDGITLTGVTISLYTKQGSQYKTATAISTDATYQAYGLMSYALTELDGLDEGYYMKVTANTTDYAFLDEYVEMDVDGTTLASIYSPIFVEVQDASGKALSVVSTTDASVAKEYVTDAGIKLKAVDGKLKFIGNEDVVYFFNLTGVTVNDGTATPVAVIGNYSDLTALYAVDGVITTEKERVTFSVVDGMGNAVTGAGFVYLKGYCPAILDDVNILGAPGARVDKHETLTVDGTFSAIIDADLYSTFTIDLGTAAATAYTIYSFESSVTSVFVANEITVGAAFLTINGSPEKVASYTIKAFDECGELIVASAAAENATIIVDPEEVAYYEATIGGAVAVGAGYFPAGLVLVSEDNAFVSPYTKITGSLPVAAAAGDYVMIEQYLGEQVVFTDRVDLAAGAKTYTIFADITGMVDEVAGIAFDSIYATYVHDGAVYASVPVDPTAVFNPIVTPGSAVIQYEAALVAPSAVIADHVGIAQVGNTVTVTADANFFVADDESIYTDGQYKYVFAGWYVDNEKVSANPVFTFTMTEDVVISPQYTVTYEKTSDVNKDVEKEYVNIVEKVEVPVEKTVGIDTNVLIIGICAVIVALIAVVYAVIKKE